MAAPTQEDINKAIAAKERAERAIDYADSIKLDVSQVEGTRYRIRFSEAVNQG